MALGEPVLAPDEKLGSIGLSLPDKDVRILDAAGRETQPGELGEICLTGGYMVGYWNRPEKTADFTGRLSSYRRRRKHRCRREFVTMRGRFAELITVADHTWFPRDVEEALAAQDGVREAAVVGLPDPKIGERPVAFVTGDAGLDLDALKAAIAPSVDYDVSWLVIRRIDRFPMTPTGKIAKAELRASALAAS